MTREGQRKDARRKRGGSTGRRYFEQLPVGAPAGASAHSYGVAQPSRDGSASPPVTLVADREARELAAVQGKTIYPFLMLTMESHEDCACQAPEFGDTLESRLIWGVEYDPRQSTAPGERVTFPLVDRCDACPFQILGFERLSGRTPTGTMESGPCMEGFVGAPDTRGPRVGDVLGDLVIPRDAGGATHLHLPILFGRPGAEGVPTPFGVRLACLSSRHGGQRFTIHVQMLRVTREGQIICVDEARSPPINVVDGLNSSNSDIDLQEVSNAMPSSPETADPAAVPLPNFLPPTTLVAHFDDPTTPPATAPMPLGMMPPPMNPQPTEPFLTPGAAPTFHGRGASMTGRGGGVQQRHTRFTWWAFNPRPDEN